MREDNEDQRAAASSSSSMSHFFTVPRSTSTLPAGNVTLTLANNPFAKKPKPTEATALLAPPPLAPPAGAINVNPEDIQAQQNAGHQDNAAPDNDIPCCYRECCCNMSVADWSYITLCTLGWGGLGAGLGWLIGGFFNCCMTSGRVSDLSEYGLSECDVAWLTLQREATAPVHSFWDPETIRLMPECNITWSSTFGATAAVLACACSRVGVENQPFMRR